MPEMLIEAKGHKNIRATHSTTWQLTTEKELTPRGDCIIGIGASLGCRELPSTFKEHLKGGGKINYTLSVGEMSINGSARGDARLTLKDPVDVVIRRSKYICDRTLAIHSTLVAADIPENMVEMLQQGENMSVRIVTVEE